MVHLEQGLEAYRSGDLETAIRELKLASQDEPISAKVFSYLGAAYASTGRYEAAVEAFQASLAINPQMAGLHFNIGQVYEAMGLQQKAFDEYENALRVDPGHSKSYEALKTLRYKMKRRL